MTSPTAPPQAGAQVELPQGSAAIRLSLARVRGILAQIPGSQRRIRDFENQADRLETTLNDSGGMGIFGLERQVELLASQVTGYADAVGNGGVHPNATFGFQGLGTVDPGPPFNLESKAREYASYGVLVGLPTYLGVRTWRNTKSVPKTIGMTVMGAATGFLASFFIDPPFS